MTYIPPGGDLIASNCTTTPLNAGATFTGTGFNALPYADIMVSCYTDQAGALYVDFSWDNTNWDSALPTAVAASTNEVHRYRRSKTYCRVRFVNTSASNQTVIRLGTIGDSVSGSITSALNSTIQADADATTVRPLDFNLMTAEGLYQNRNNTIKSGVNFDVDTGVSLSSPQDVHNTTGGGAYSGFPATAQAAEIYVAGADTGTVYYSYMATDTDTDYTFGSKAITGVGTYSLGHNIWRCNFAYFDSGGTATNVGAITVQSTAGPGTYKFCEINAGYGESQCAAYTVPYGSSVYLDMERSAMRGAASGNMDGWWYYKEYGKSPRIRWPFELSAGNLYFDEIDFLQSIPSRADICPRVTYSSANNQIVRFKYRFIKVKS